MKTVDLYNPFKKHRRMRSLAIPQHNQQVSSEEEVFDILEEGHEERSYKNPLMDCTSMGEYLDVLSAHDIWKDGKSLKTQVDSRSLDLGFLLSDDDQMTGNHHQPWSDILDMQFHISLDDNRSHDEILDLGFPPQPDDGDELDLGFDIDVDDPAEDGALDMGFNTYPADDFLNIGNNIPPEENPLEMGFEMDPVHIDLDQSFTVSRPDSIGFVIQRAVGDLHVAMHRLDMDRAGDTMTPDEAFAIQQVLDCAQELSVLACQLISISQLST
ncbi:uncharacterized protein HD556DRAFT_1441106 [Suillus plorans]|uniref:Uncharacterized protein n=1 Tax=Suillus plorans TaxID=116603 RepID=A0A9P7DKA0_9AGAM|nr:uncharacterized protein HD556DRAFT_1441106 [Suillus plorans]KAG1796932.1 hypothetical protein HD556DRAFT_1441106 [Suillus plorans]